SIAVRLLPAGDAFWRLWLPGAGAVVAFGSTLHWGSSLGTDVWGAPALALVGVGIALSPAGRLARLWGAVASFALALGMALETAGYSATDQSLTWAGIGLVLVLAANTVRRAPASHLAVIGHLLGTGSLLFFPSGPARAVVLGAWAVGWIASLIASELEGDTVTALLDRAAGRTGDKWLAAAAGWPVPVMVVVSTPLAVITALDLWDSYAAHTSWNGVTLALIGVGYVAASRLFDSHRPSSRALALAATIASLGGVALAVPDSWPMIIATLSVIAVAGLLGPLRPTWFVWAAWIDTVLLAVLLGDRAGVPLESLHLVALVWGAILLVGGLAGDDVIAGRRQIGELLRVEWLRYPSLIGAVVMPLALAPVYTEPQRIYGWWSIGVATVYLLVAYLVRAGSVTVPGLGLLAVGFTALSPVSPLDEPWVYIALAAPLVGLSWVFARYQSELAARSVWGRWDLAPLAVAHLIGGFALLTAFENQDLLLTELAFGLLSIVVGIWRRGRVWVEAGNVLIILAAMEAGGAWPALVLAATSVRGIIGARVAEEKDRLSYLLIAVVSAGLTWLAVIDWQAYPVDRAVDFSGYLFGALALVLTMTTRTGRLRDDALAAWGGLATTGLLAAAIPVAAGSETITGFGLTTGFALLAVSLQLLWQRMGPSLRLLPPIISALAWLTMIPAAGWDRSTALRVSAVVFGTLMVVVAEIFRFRVPSPDGRDRALSAARTWTGLAFLGVLIAASFYRGDAGDGYALTIGGALLSVGLARAAVPLALARLRETSMVTGLATINVLANASGWEQTLFAVGLVVLAVTTTLASLWIWRVAPDSVWVGALVVLALVTNIETFLLAIATWPARALLVAVLLSVAAQALAIGIVRSRPDMLAISPPAIAAAFILGVAESISGSAQWYTIPIALVLLSEVEILRAVRRAGEGETQGWDVIVLEWAGIGLLAGPGLVEMFTNRLAFGLIPFAMAVAILLWAIVSRVRRRAIAAASIAVVSAVLLLFAAAAEAAPASAVFWILAAGIGISVMLVAGLLEAYRSRRGQAMARVGVLMEGWE
ncbi:MAG TPA: hypothetical protein VLA91_08320, partial [Acidimicrobiia bacterium]|nr:hypothetical protein [Acidimicrobiia bacterium]